MRGSEMPTQREKDYDHHIAPLIEHLATTAEAYDVPVFIATARDGNMRVRTMQYQRPRSPVERMLVWLQQQLERHAITTGGTVSKTELPPADTQETH